jgi:putative resolvase
MSLPTTEYLPARTIKKHYGVCTATLRRWAEKGQVRAIKTPGGKRLYHSVDIQRSFGFDAPPTRADQKAKVCYARVSTRHQQGDLDRQVQDLKQAFPTHEIVQDVGSGLNWNRKGFGALLDRVQQGTVGEIVVAHRDRLCRFAFQLVERFCKAFGTKLVVRDETDDRHGTTEELSDDLMSIVTVFVARNNGKRAAENRRNRKRQAEEKEKELHGQQEKDRRKAPRRKKQKGSSASDAGSTTDSPGVVWHSPLDVQQMFGGGHERGEGPVQENPPIDLCEL